MAVRFALRRILPSVLVYAALLATALLVDLVLHLAGAASVGRWLGLGGAGLIALSFAYSLRKRRIITRGEPRRLLQAHELLGWLGAAALVVHAGVHFNAALPWLALAALLIVVASGLTGKYLLAEARASLAREQAALAAEGLAPAEVERRLLSHALVVDVMQRWRKVHMPLTMVFVGLAAVHVAAVLLFWRWAP